MFDFFTPKISRLRLKKLGERERLPLEIWIERFYANSGLDLVRIRHVMPMLAEGLELPVEVLLPADRFEVELAPIEDSWATGIGVGFSVMLLTQSFEREFGISIDWAEIATIDDYLRAVCKVSTSNNP